MSRIVILINSLSGGGAERVVSVLLNELCRENECYLILLENDVDYKLDERVKIISLNENANLSGLMKLIRLPLLAFRLSKIIKKYEFAQIVSFLYRANYINILSSIFVRHKTIISERIAPSAMHASGSTGAKINKFLIKILYGKADLVISVSQAIRLDLIKNFHTSTKQVVVYNPYDLEKIYLQSNKNIGININQKSIITAGTLCDRKNQQLILRAFANINDKEYTLYLLGKGKNESKLRKLSVELGIENKVFFLGFDSNPYKYLSKCSIFIFGSNAEGFPNALVEAMACGCAVISTDCLSGPREILSPDSDINFSLKDDIELGEFGILTPVGSQENLTKALNLLINDGNLRALYAQKAKRRANDFNVKKIIGEYKCIFC